MSLRQTTGSVVCPSCGRLVGIGDAKCYHCGRSNPGMWGFTPVLRRLGQDMGLSSVVTTACVVLYLLSLAVDPYGVTMDLPFGFLGPSGRSSFLLGASGFVPVFMQGHWWTVLSAGWLHGGILHIGFNLMWVRHLAPAMAELYGAGRTATIYVVSGALGFVLSSCAPWFWPESLWWFMGIGGLTLGASSALFGLLGALVHYSRRTGKVAMGRQIWSWAIGLFVIGIVMDGIDNWAHLGGFLGGWLIAWMLDPLKPERVDHLIGGLVCLFLSLVAIVVSVAIGWPQLWPVS